MAQTGATDSFRLTARQWGLLVLLVLSIQINYFDRGALSIAAPLIGAEMSVTPDRIGILLSAFFWTYAFSLVAAGRLVDRYGARKVLGLGFLIWTLATLGSGMARTFLALLTMRMILGIGESVAYPSYSKIFVDRFPAQRRGLVNALIDTGAKLGQGVGTFVGGLFIADFGWRALFTLLGVASLLWLGPWFKWAPRSAHFRSPLWGSNRGTAEVEVRGSVARRSRNQTCRAQRVAHRYAPFAFLRGFSLRVRSEDHCNVARIWDDPRKESVGRRIPPRCAASKQRASASVCAARMV